jgi:isopenicillin N synthase-like dioxygenase
MYPTPSAAASIPAVDVGPLFGPPGPARIATDRAILNAAAGIGFMTITGMPAAIAPTPERRAALLRLFQLSDTDKARLFRRKFSPSQANVYRGWFPLSPGGATYKEGIDIGPDLAHAEFPVDGTDPLTEATPLPSEASLPGWRATAAAYYRGMEGLGAVMMQSVARGLGLPETTFDAAFAGGISTLRLIHYPVRGDATFAGADAEKVFVEHAGQRRYVIGAAHIDSGFVTLLAQDGVEGLQARAHDGSWVDVPPVEGTLAVNFGGLLEKWTGGRIKATEHRILGPGRTRFSIPFFYEPQVAAVIRPLPLADAAPFAPFLYGDHLWASSTKFVEFQGLESLRPPRGVSLDR